MVSSTIASDSAWVDVELRHKWLDMDLQKTARVSKTSKRTLETLTYESEEILKGFMSTINGNVMEITPINLSDSVIIVNSMYKITNTLLLDYADESFADAQLFEKLSVIIADVFAACLSNLPHVILKKCSNSAVEEREKNIREATRLLGETQGIMKAIQKREIPNLSRDQLIYIDEWCALLKRTNHGISDSTLPLIRILSLQVVRCIWIYNNFGQAQHQVRTYTYSHSFMFPLLTHLALLVFTYALYCVYLSPSKKYLSMEAEEVQGENENI